MKLTVVVPIDPMPCPRPRVRAFGKFATTYYPAPYKKWREEFARHVPKRDAPMEGQFRVLIQSWVKKARTSKLVRPVGDVDNYAKSVLDVLTDLNYWPDDVEVVSVTSEKFFTDASPRIHIEITPA